MLSTHPTRRRPAGAAPRRPAPVRLRRRRLRGRSGRHHPRGARPRRARRQRLAARRRQGHLGDGVTVPADRRLDLRGPAPRRALARTAGRAAAQRARPGRALPRGGADGRRPAGHPRPRSHQRGRRAARPARRDLPLRRPRPGPGPLRRGRASGAGADGAGAGSLRARARPARHGPPHPGAGDLPGHAGHQRGARGHAPPAPPRPGARGRAPPRDAGGDGHARRRARPRQPARPAHARYARAGQLLPPSGSRRSGRAYAQSATQTTAPSRRCSVDGAGLRASACSGTPSCSWSVPSSSRSSRRWFAPPSRAPGTRRRRRDGTRRAAGLGDVGRGSRAVRVDDRAGGGGDAARSRTDWMLAHRIDDLLPMLSPELAAHVAAETHACTLELFTGVHRTVAGLAPSSSASAGTCARSSTRSVCARRRGAARTRSPPPRTRTCRVARATRCSRAAFAIWRAARADLRAPRARGRPSARARDRGPRPGPGPPPPLPRPVRELSLLARTRQRDGIVSHPAVPGLPTRRDPAPLRQLRRLRRVHRRAAARRCLPRPDLRLVGRAAPTAAGDPRGTDRGRPDDRRRGGRACRPDPSARAPRGHRATRHRRVAGRARGVGGEPLPRLARRYGGPADRPRGGHARSGGSVPGGAAGAPSPMPATCSASPSWPPSASSHGDRAPSGSVHSRANTDCPRSARSSARSSSAAPSPPATEPRRPAPLGTRMMRARR